MRSMKCTRPKCLGPSLQAQQVRSEVTTGPNSTGYYIRRQGRLNLWKADAAIRWRASSEEVVRVDIHREPQVGGGLDSDPSQARR